MNLNFRPTLAYSKTPELSALTYPLYVSPKLDGFRCVVADGIAYTRYMKRVACKYVVEELKKLELHGFDGELMVPGDFESAQSAFTTVHARPDFTYNVFDLFDHPGVYEQRFAELQRRVAFLGDTRVKLVPQRLIHSPEKLQEVWDAFVVKGYEGGITRIPSAPYKQGRSTLNQQYIIKLKHWYDDEAEVIGVKELEENQNEAFIGELGQTKRQTCKENMVGKNMLGALICKWGDRQFSVGTGFTEEQRIRLWKEELIGKKVTFKYQQLTKYGKPRFPVFKAFREAM